MARLEIGTFGESQGDLPDKTNYLEDGAKGVKRFSMNIDSNTLICTYTIIRI